MTPFEYLEAARVPRSLRPQEFGLWTIQRLLAGGQRLNGLEQAQHAALCGWPDYTLLRRLTEATMNTRGEIVMEDSYQELSRHLPIWLAAKGRVLVTGLGLGCVVRGLLANPEVEHVDVVEIDAGIIRVIGPEFDSTRVTVHHGDALEIRLNGKWDYAWHDLWIEGPGLQRLHARLMSTLRDRVGDQGAWAFPRLTKRALARHGIRLLGGPRAKERAA